MSKVKVFQLFLLTASVFLFYNCDQDDKFIITGITRNLNDFQTTSIYANIPFINQLSGNAQSADLLCMVSVYNQEFTIIHDLSLLNFNLQCTYPDGYTQCIDNFHFIDTDIDDPLLISITMDYSGSMSDSDIEHMESAVIQLLDLLDPDSKVQIIKFASYVEVMNEFTNDHNLLIEVIQQDFDRGATAFYDAVYTGIEEIDAFMRQTSESYIPMVFAFTDGYDNVSNVTMDDLIEHAVTKLIPIFTIGLGYVDESGMMRMAMETGGIYQYTTFAEEIEEMFETIIYHMNNLYFIGFTIDKRNSASIMIQLYVEYECATGVHKTEAYRNYFF